MGHLLLTVVLIAIAGCAVPLPFERDPGWPGDHALVLLGEQHDAAEHQRIAARVVARLARQGRLAALAIEMAERGRSTAGLATDAGDDAVRAALAWDARGWPWAAYGPVVMAAVRAGVPVVGANLPRTETRAAMADAAIDALVDAPVRAQLQDDVRSGHCDLLPAAQLPAMTRVQIGRDRALAETLAQLAAQAAQAAPGRVVLLLAGAQHVDATRGAPLHLRALAPGLRVLTVRLAAGGQPGESSAGFDAHWPTPAVERDEPCRALAEQLGRKPR